MTGAEEVTFPAADGAQLVSWYLRATSPRATVLFFHGNAGNLSHRTDILQTLARLDADVLIVGYHGYGKSQASRAKRASTWMLTPLTHT